MTHYTTLGLAPDASNDAIKAAYKQFALHSHPDRASGSTDTFLRVKRAFDCLSDAGARRAYDASLASARAVTLAETIDEHELEIITVMSLFDGGGGRSIMELDAHGRGHGSGGLDVYARRCRCGDAYEIPRGELAALKATHDECVLECGGCSLKIGVRLAPPGSGSGSSGRGGGGGPEGDLRVA